MCSAMHGNKLISGHFLIMVLMMPEKMSDINIYPLKAKFIENYKKKKIQAFKKSFWYK